MVCVRRTGSTLVSILHKRVIGVKDHLHGNVVAHAASVSSWCPRAHHILLVLRVLHLRMNLSGLVRYLEINALISGNLCGLQSEV